MLNGIATHKTNSMKEQNMIIKEAIGIDSLLFNIGKHLFKSESDLVAWKKEWLDKGVIGKTSRDMVELIYTKEHKERTG